MTATTPVRTSADCEPDLGDVEERVRVPVDDRAADERVGDPRRAGRPRDQPTTVAADEPRARPDDEPRDDRPDRHDRVQHQVGQRTRRRQSCSPASTAW